MIPIRPEKYRKGGLGKIAEDTRLESHQSQQLQGIEEPDSQDPRHRQRRRTLPAISIDLEGDEVSIEQEIARPYQAAQIHQESSVGHTAGSRREATLGGATLMMVVVIMKAVTFAHECPCNATAYFQDVENCTSRSYRHCSRRWHRACPLRYSILVSL